MKQTLGKEALRMRVEQAIEAHHKGQLSRKRLLSLLKCELAGADDHMVRTLLTDDQENQNLDADLLDELSRTYTENVQHWDFPEEPGLSWALPDAVECSFPELVQSAYSSMLGLIRVRNMLLGVNVRLNLRGSYSVLGEALNMVIEELDSLEQACEYVGSGTPLAPRFLDQKQSAWDSRDGVPLSPKQIVWLAGLGQEDPQLSLKYADGLSWHSTPPQLVTDQIRAREQQQIREAEYREIKDLDRKAMAQACPRCNSAPGALCRTRAGNETWLHKGRYAKVS